MSKRLTGILLIISIAFNLAFLGTFIYHRYIAKPPFPPDFPRKPHPEFLELIKENRKEIHMCRSRFSRAKEDFMKALRDPNTTNDELQEKLSYSMGMLMELERTIGNTLIAAREKLTPEQRLMMFDKMKDDHPRHDRPKDRPQRLTD